MSNHQYQNKHLYQQRLKVWNYFLHHSIPLLQDMIPVQTPILPAIDDFGRGREVFFNQIVAAAAGWANAVDDDEPRLCFGDQTRIESADLKDAIAASYQCTVDLEWQKGDVALLDNLRVMHGRRPFTGSRSILASLCSPISRSAKVI